MRRPDARWPFRCDRLRSVAAVRRLETQCREPVRRVRGTGQRRRRRGQGDPGATTAATKIADADTYAGAISHRAPSIPRVKRDDAPASQRRSTLPRRASESAVSRRSGAEGSDHTIASSSRLMVRVGGRSPGDRVGSIRRRQVERRRTRCRDRRRRQRQPGSQATLGRESPAGPAGVPSPRRRGTWECRAGAGAPRQTGYSLTENPITRAAATIVSTPYKTCPSEAPAQAHSGPPAQPNTATIDSTAIARRKLDSITRRVCCTASR